MNTKIVKILLVAVIAVLALGAIGLGVAYAQNPTPTNPFYPGGMMRGFWGQAGGPSSMAAMHSWMTSTGGMHTLVWEAVANALGITTDELNAELTNGKSLADLAEEKGLDRAALVTELESAHEAGLSQAVADGVLTQDQANAMLAQMEGRYEWMLDNMTSGSYGYGMMRGRGGMMGRFFGRSSSSGGQFGPGGCHGNFVPSASANNP